MEVSFDNLLSNLQLIPKGELLGAKGWLRA